MKHGRVWLGFNLTAICAVTMVFAGCSTPSIFREYEIHDDKATSILIDAKQRAILAVHSPQLAKLEENSSQDKDKENSSQDEPEGTDLSEQQGQSEENKSEKNEQSTRLRQVIVCAEPSPDALSSISNILSASIGNGISGSNDGSGNATIDQALEEIAQKLAARNATIQLLRDGLYRQCEAYLNGMIDKKEYKDLADRYIDGMVALLAIERITPDPAEDKASDSKTESVSTETQGQSPSHAEPPSKEAIEAVRDITRAFLDRSQVDKCMDSLSANKQSAIDMCLFIATSKLSETDKAFIKSNVRGLMDALTENSKLNEKTTSALGKANGNLTKTTTALGATKEELAVTNKNLTETDQTLGKTSDDLKATKEELAKTNKNLTKTTDVLSNTNETLGETNAALSETKEKFANTLNTTNENLGKATTALSTTNEKLEKVGESLPKPDSEDDVNAEPLNGNEAKTSQETNGQVSDEGETADQKSQQ